MGIVGRAFALRALACGPGVRSSPVRSPRRPRPVVPPMRRSAPTINLPAPRFPRSVRRRSAGLVPFRSGTGPIWSCHALTGEPRWRRHDGRSGRLGKVSGLSGGWSCITAARHPPRPVSRNPSPRGNSIAPQRHRRPEAPDRSGRPPRRRASGDLFTACSRRPGRLHLRGHPPRP